MQSPVEYFSVFPTGITYSDTDVSMAPLNIAGAVESFRSRRFSVAIRLVLIILYSIVEIVHNVYFHPLAKIPASLMAIIYV